MDALWNALWQTDTTPIWWLYLSAALTGLVIVWILKTIFDR
jgi:hypothetical protein